MKKKIFKFLKYLLVALCSAVCGYFNSSCTAGIVMGNNSHQKQEQTVNTKIDSTVTPKLIIN